MIQETDVLNALKISLGITTDAYDQRLLGTIESAKTEIAREGANLNPDSIDDMQTVIMYADWMWRKRDTGDAMPRMLRYRLNNRVLQEKAR